MNDGVKEDSNDKQEARLNTDASRQAPGPGRGDHSDVGPPIAQSARAISGPDCPDANKSEVAGTPPHVPSHEEVALYANYMAEIQKRELSGIEHFDKSVLTLSSAGLGLSVTLLKDVVPLDKAVYLSAMYISWTLFVVAILSTLLSFMVSVKAHDRQKGVASRAYLQGDEAAFNEPNSFDTLTRALNYTSAGAFVLALILTTVFVIINMERNRMAITHQPASASEKKGATVPTMQRPSAPAPAPAPAPASPQTGSK